MALQPFYDPLRQTGSQKIWGIHFFFCPTYDLWLGCVLCLIFRFWKNFLINSNLIIQNVIKISKKQPVQVSTFNLLTEVKALMILAILFITYFIRRITDLFVLGAVFCSIAFLVFFRCKKRSYYAITIGMAVLIWAAFRFGLNVKF